VIEGKMDKIDIEKIFESITINKAPERDMLSQALRETDSIRQILYERLREIGE
jgi:hypothetical protein